jgi:hypothetical protein
MLGTIEVSCKEQTWGQVEDSNKVQQWVALGAIRKCHPNAQNNIF